MKPIYYYQLFSNKEPQYLWPKIGSPPVLNKLSRNMEPVKSHPAIKCQDFLHIWNQQYYWFCLSPVLVNKLQESTYTLCSQRGLSGKYYFPPYSQMPHVPILCQEWSANYLSHWLIGTKFLLTQFSLSVSPFPTPELWIALSLSKLTQGSLLENRMASG